MPLKKKILLQWEEAKIELDIAKEKEMDLRKEICSEILQDQQKGVKHFKKFGLDAAATAKLNQKLDVDTIKSIFKKLDKQEKACIKYDPKLVAANYKELPEDSIFHSAVESTPSTPSLKIKHLEE